MAERQGWIRETDWRLSPHANVVGEADESDREEGGNQLRRVAEID